MEILFITGIPRSGTTLLKSLLIAHSKLTGTDYESTGIFGIRDIFKYRLGEISNEVIRSDLQDASSIIDFYEKVVTHILNRNGASLFVDKLQPRYYRYWYVQKYFPKAKFIHIIRDGRDCFCSARKHPNVRQSTSPRAFARYWKNAIQAVRRHLPKERTMEIRYESLTARPQEELSRLMEFIGYPLEMIQLDPQIYARTSSMRKREVHQNLNNTINTKGHERWRRELTENEVKSFNAHASDLLEKYGYTTY